ncbi:DUF3137 domain-containing protein [Williamwhitmania taraxaci]|uniref:DUF3137 domain-containing protein n=1 Tax=Williamwhitmania taraxaci TaxID=1640674 RepID=A0A1G6R6Q6_9BACT|nr:DUF3137 domain-containing protein [Williamwhitmania taraxaci]SDC99737.1 Protein of unknown function [Williamwhitmania taraxaci]
MIIVFQATSHRDDFKKFFDSIKHEYIAAMLKQIDSSFEYSSESLPLEDVQQTGLFDIKYTESLQGNDYFNGNYKGVKLQIGEISFESKDSKKGDNFFKPSTLIIAEFNKTINSETIIFDNEFYDNGGTKKVDSLQVISHYKNNSIALENPEFEAAFSTSSNDEIEARYLLSYSFMERLLNLKYQLDKCKINVAFSNNKVAILLYNKQIFEPSLSKSVKEDRIFIRFQKETVTILKIVDALRLNERIWK